MLALVHAVVALEGKDLESDPDLHICFVFVVIGTTFVVRRDWYDVDVRIAAVRLVL